VQPEESPLVASTAFHLPTSLTPATANTVESRDNLVHPMEASIAAIVNLARARSSLAKCDEVESAPREPGNGHLRRHHPSVDHGQKVHRLDPHFRPQPREKAKTPATLRKAIAEMEADIKKTKPATKRAK
jgi:hypothetical protein